jgi:hypothetical protein
MPKPQRAKSGDEDQALQLKVFKSACDVVDYEVLTTQAIDRVEKEEIDTAQIGYQGVHHEELPALFQVDPSTSLKKEGTRRRHRQLMQSAR